MARTNYSKNFVKPARREGTKSRHEYLQNLRAEAKRGHEISWSKLLDIDVIDIRSARRQRMKLMQHIKDNLSDAALAKKYNVHPRTIEKVQRYETWGHLP